MAPPATELAFLPLVSGATVEDRSTDAGIAWRETLNILADQPGFIDAFYNRQIENPSVLSLVIDWESLEAHRAFMDSEIYGPFGKRLEALLSDPPHLYHVHFKTPFNKPASAPVTEMVALYFAPDYKPSDFDPDFGKFTAVLEKSAEGYRGSAGGWVVEELEYDGQKGKAFVAAIGWDSIDAHKAYRETEAFSNSIGALRAATRGIDLFHAMYQKDVKVF